MTQKRAHKRWNKKKKDDKGSKKNGKKQKMG